MSLYRWPDAGAFGRVVAKNRIYEHTKVSGAIKSRFVTEVGQIRWAYKLSPETTGLAATEALQEFQVFRIEQRVPELHINVLQTIDRAIPFPILFELAYEGQIKLKAAYKRPHAQGGDRWVFSDYFESPWRSQNNKRTPLPQAIDLSRLYEEILIRLIDELILELVRDALAETLIASPNEKKSDPLSLNEQIYLFDQIQGQVREVQKLMNQVRRERQFNKRVDLNSQLKRAQRALIQLIPDNLKKP